MDGHRAGGSLTGVPKLGRMTVVGAAAGALVVGGPFAVGVLAAGGGPLGVGGALHVGLFAGVGFGGMVGAVLAATRAEGSETSSEAPAPLRATARTDETTR